jgi:hypothetical protein
MGTIVSLDEYRRRRHIGVATGAMGRLDLAVRRLDPLVRSKTTRLTPTIERELLAIAKAVSVGEATQAADRAERLVNLLEHPAASG